MAKKTYSYALVGSFYDAATGVYHEQESIKLNDINLDSLEKIDSFTTGISYVDFCMNLPEQYQNKNQFSVRVINNNTGQQYFLRTIFSQPKLYEALQEVRSKTVLLAGRGYRTLSLLPQSPFIEESWKTVRQLLEKKDETSLAAYFGSKSSYLFELRGYMNNSFDEGYESEELNSLYTEFRNYPVFRNFIVESNKKSRSLRVYTPKNAPIYMEPLALKSREFGEKYLQEQAYAYNNLGEKEEFLTVEEILEFQPFADSGDDFYPSLAKKAKKKRLRNSHDEQSYCEFRDEN